MNRDWTAVLREHQQVVAALADQGAVLDAIADGISAALRAGGRVYTFGNGGSAADAQHIAGELLGRFKRERSAYAVTALNTDVSTLTAIANDYGYERVFARQIEGLARAGDVVWAFSTSGNAANVLAGVHAGTARGALTIGFTGGTGGQLAPLCMHVFRAPHTATDRIQEAHALAYHYVCERIETALDGA